MNRQDIKGLQAVHGQNGRRDEEDPQCDQSADQASVHQEDCVRHQYQAGKLSTDGKGCQVDKEEAEQKCHPFEGQQFQYTATLEEWQGGVFTFSHCKLFTLILPVQPKEMKQ